ncbi:MAG: CBS domain-containing protein [Desulfobulbus sp.]|jgi:CBS domain-containing protein|nr:CBS domain-containing protein [Desulfobulbaceae bacterium]
MTVRELLAAKGNKVFTINENSTLKEAISMFFDKKIGSLLVVDADNAVVGILAPNDVLKTVHAGCGDQCDVQQVKAVMTANPICASEDDTLEYLEAVMTKNRIRHIPIMEKQQLKGLISIGDIVNAQLEVREVEIRHLTDYIEGKYPG